MAFFYNLSIYFYGLLIRFAAFRSDKAKKWIRGRKNVFSDLKNNIRKNDRIAWFHCASLGEFEQGRPVVESFREKYQGMKILLTFFSPSGYEIRKNYQYADYVFYLPLDTPQNAKKFIERVNPEIAVFIKYEYWFNYIKVLTRKSIPVVVISAVFRENQHFFKWYGGWFRKQLRKINWFFVQNQQSEYLLRKIGIKKLSLSGDTRFDRVWQIVENDERCSLIEKFIANDTTVIGGSTWLPDEIILKDAFDEFKSLKFIIAPHLISKDHINDIIHLFDRKNCILYSELSKEDLKEKKVLIVDAIGFLFKLYKYAKYAFIGGGFGVSIHNILEAAVFGKPVFFGPNHKKFKEAKDLISLKGAFEIKTSNNAIELINHFENNRDFYQKSSNSCRKYVEDNKGATRIILDKMETFLLP